MKNVSTAASAVIIRRTFKSARERVFAAWTDPKLLGAWFAPPTMVVNDVTCDARLGGSYRIVMNAADGEAFNVRGTYTEYDPPTRLAYTFRWEEDDPALEHESFVSIDFVEHAGGTEMIFTHDRFASEDSRNNHEGGWTAIFDQLIAFVDAHSGSESP